MGAHAISFVFFLRRLTYYQSVKRDNQLIVYCHCHMILTATLTISWAVSFLSGQICFRYTLSGGRLTIQNPKVGEDADFYRCTVENDQGIIMSQIAQIMFGCKLPC